MSYYVVRLKDLSLSWDAAMARGGRFPTEALAIECAKGLAAEQPGQSFEVTRAIIKVACQVSVPLETKLV